MRLPPALFCLLLATRCFAADGPPTTPESGKQAETPAPRCTLLVRAKLDMAMDETGRITVPVVINGTSKRMMVDTGASKSMLTLATARELNLDIGVLARGRFIVGVGGTPSIFVAHVDEFVLGSSRTADFRINVGFERMEAAGLLGADFLSQFDVDLDFANAKMNLVRRENCNDTGDVVYWSRKPYGVIPFEIDANHIMVKVKLDGVDIRAALDTGAADTIMSLDKASDAFDLDEDKLMKSRHYPFKTLTFGEVTINNPAIALLTDRESVVMGHHSSDLHMIIGMGVLRRLHLYISYTDKMIYVTPATQY